MNKRTRMGLAVLAALLIAPAAAQEKKAGKTDQEKPKPQFSAYYHQKVSHFEGLPDTAGEIVFLGDSITDGGSWSEMFQDIRVKNRGISGDITEGVLERLKEITRAKPAKIFLMIGINDLARGAKPKDVVTNIRKIVTRIGKQSPDTVIYLQSVLPVNPDMGMFKDHTDKGPAVKAVNQRLAKLAESLKITYIDLYPAFAGPDGKLKPEYTNEGLHLTGAGYRLWKSLIEAYVK